jgi:hypothetical protein
MTGRWGFILGLAGIGFFLYSSFHPGSPSRQTANISAVEGNSPDSGFRRNAQNWQSPRSWTGFSLSPGSKTSRRSAFPLTGNSSRHDLDSQSTVYIGSGTVPASSPMVDNPLIALVKSVFSNGRTPISSMISGNHEMGRSSGGSRGVPSGTTLKGRIVRDVEGPGSQVPIYVVILPQSFGAIRIGYRFELMGYPDGLTEDRRLKIRFIKALYRGGFETPMSGYALSGGREGVPIRLSDHFAGNMSRSFGRDSLMLGGAAVGTAGWSGSGNLADALGMEEGGTLLYEAQNGLSSQNRQPSYVLDQHTPIDVLVVQGFPLADSLSSGSSK